MTDLTREQFATIRTRVQAAHAENKSGPILAPVWLYPAEADALIDAAETVDRVTALADEWEARPDDKNAGACAADLRAALAAPDNHNKEEADA